MLIVMHVYVIKDTVSLKHLEAVKSCIIDSNFEQTLTPQLCLGLGVVTAHDHEDILATDPGLHTVSIQSLRLSPGSGAVSFHL